MSTPFINFNEVRVKSGAVPEDLDDLVNLGYLQTLGLGFGVVFKGSVPDLTALAAVLDPQEGDIWYVESEENLYIRREDSWLNVGPEGPEGPVGPEGPEGPVGPEGPEGPVGSEGPEGPVGPEGPEGPAGPTGPAGEDGTDGEDGTGGVSVSLVFQKANDQPITPDSSPVFPPIGWEADITALPSEESPIWVSVGHQDPVTDVWTWQLPVRLTGELLPSPNVASGPHPVLRYDYTLNCPYWDTDFNEDCGNA